MLFNGHVAKTLATSSKFRVFHIIDGESRSTTTTSTTTTPVPGPQGGCDPVRVEVSPGEVIEGALVSRTEPDGLYPNHVCQRWNITASEGQVTEINSSSIV